MQVPTPASTARMPIKRLTGGSRICPLTQAAHALESRQCERGRVGVAAAHRLFPDSQVIAHEDDDRTPILRGV